MKRRNPSFHGGFSSLIYTNIFYTARLLPYSDHLKNATVDMLTITMKIPHFPLIPQGLTMPNPHMVAAYMYI